MREKNNLAFLKVTLTILLFKHFFITFTYGKSLSELIAMTPIDQIREEGYEAETHEVTTEDGYILEMHRIPGKPGSTAVFLEHGFTASSFDYIVTGRNKAIAFILADHGYDIWLGNNRGNTYSRRHVKLKPEDPQFWDFSFHEMGIYDVPAMITYITNLKNDSLIFMGHSLGATLAFVMAIERPEFTPKIRVILTMGPAVFLQHWKTPFRLLAQNYQFTANFLEAAKMHEFLPQNPAMSKTILKNLCYELTERNPCAQLIFLLDGYNPTQFNFTILPLLFSHNPAGSSSKTLLHFLQMARVNKFQQYDYGPAGNMAKYNCSHPPEYDLSRIKLPVGIFWSDSDIFCSPIDTVKLIKAIPNKAVVYRIPVKTFTHIDFLLAIDAPTLVYSKLLSVMEDYR